MASAQNEPRLSSYRKLLLQLSSELSSNDLEKLKFAAIDVIPRGMTENISNGFKLFDVLEQDGRITPQNPSLLEDMLRSVGRMDLALKVQRFSKSLLNNERDRIEGDADDNVHDGTGTNYSEENGSAVPGNWNGIPLNKDEGVSEQFNDDVPDGVSDDEAVSNKHMRSMDTGSRVRRERLETEKSLFCEKPALLEYSLGDAQAETISASGGSQYAACKDKRLHSIGPSPVRYVDYLAKERYSVEIIGGKHFKTPEGEFVEIKSGTQYKIHVKNSRTYDCNLDISIDGYDVGGWIVDAGQELSIERSAYEAKKFTFYRVKTAPKEAGIESGRAENGLVKCVFTPEAFLDIPVIISGSPQPLVVNIAPSATVEDLKRKVQTKLSASPDVDQILALNDTEVIPNGTRLSHALKSPGKLRLLDSELEITIRTSASQIFHVTIQPGKAKVLDLMEQIEKKLEIPIKDQKLYHGKARLSDAPGRRLPEQLICSLEPSLVVIVPEYIQITVEDVRSGAPSVVEIDKNKTLIDLIEEVPSCRSLQENEEATFYVREKPLCPSKEDGSLESLGISSGSKVRVEVKIAFIEIIVTGLSRILPKHSSRFRCHPEDTLRDLLNRVEARGSIKKFEGATFSMQERAFDPEKDISPLQDYGIKHHSTLQLNLAEAQLSEDSSMSQQRKEFIERREESLERLKILDTTLFQNSLVLTERDPAWRAGGTTLQRYSTQHFIPATDPIKVDPSKKVVLELRLVAREDETEVVFPEEEFKPLSTLHPPAVQE